MTAFCVLQFDKYHIIVWLSCNLSITAEVLYRDIIVTVNHVSLHVS